ncbi:AraC family transcriptional regulator [Ramlibacter tataouinensis]|uniref:AraC family transcriptional regulator n=1 Tax=Ramlibacter tataouinensis TaxID=94132 RepID=UPI0022F3E399|nr:AraC family transcriptional regulator [Ramlibacter tataouinensis]WBY03685.1 AraC family transcriptional regulator [Ramlibacter tataouinensis]
MSSAAGRAPGPAPAAATPIAFARAIVAAYRRYGGAPDEALRTARIAPAQLRQPQGRMTARQMELLSAAAMQELDDEGLGAFSRKLPWGSYGLLARASLTAPDLGVALGRWCRHHGLLVPDIRLELATTGDSAVVRLHELVPLQPAARELSIAFILRNVHGLACWYVDSRIPLQGADFPFAAPPHADAYAHMFPGGPLSFGQAPASIRFDARYLALPLRRDEKALSQLLRQRALSVTVLQYRRDRLLVPQVRQALAAHPGRSHSAESVAGLLHLSARTLHRQLKAEGASLQQLKDEVRFDLARDLLLRTARPLKQVAVAAGFRNEKSFARAFKARMGAAPGEFRAAGGSSSRV